MGVIRDSFYALERIPREDYALMSEIHPVSMGDPLARSDPRIRPITQILLSFWPMPNQEALTHCECELFRPFAVRTRLSSKRQTEPVHYRFCVVCNQLAEPCTTMRQCLNNTNRYASDRYEHFLGCEDLPIESVTSMMDNLDANDPLVMSDIVRLIAYLSKCHSSVSNRLQRRIDHFYLLLTSRRLRVHECDAVHREILIERAVEATHLIRRFAVLCEELKKYAAPPLLLPKLPPPS